MSREDSPTPPRLLNPHNFVALSILRELIRRGETVSDHLVSTSFDAADTFFKEAKTRNEQFKRHASNP